MSNSNNGSNNSNSNNGGSMKSKLIINDLAFYSNSLAVGNSSLAHVSNEGDLFSEFAGHGLSVDQMEWMISQEENKNERTVEDAKAVLEANGVDYDSTLSDEIIMLLAEQHLDNVSNTIGYTSNRSEGVLVIVQEQSSNGNWYTVTKKDPAFTGNESIDKQVDILLEMNGKKKTTYWYDVETLFEKHNGVIVGLKTKKVMIQVNDKATRSVKTVETVLPVIVADMRANGHIVDGFIGRLLLKSSAFIRGTVINGERIEEVPAQFNYAFKNGEVVQEQANFAWDNTVEVFPGVSVLPSDSDTTQAQLDEMVHDENIIVGMAVITPAMSAYYTEAAERNAQLALEAECNTIAVKSSIPVIKRNKATKKVLESLAGETAKYIIDLSSFNAKDAIEVAEESKEQIVEIIAAIATIKRVTGTGVPYAVFKALLAIKEEVEKPAMEAATKAIEMHILENIASLNSGAIDISDLTDEEAVEILDAAIANAKLVPAAKIEFNVYRPLSERVKAIKFGNKVAEAKEKFSA